MKKIITIIIMALTLFATLAINAQTITDTLTVPTEKTTTISPNPQNDTAVSLQENLSKAIDVMMKITAIIQIILAFFIAMFTVMVVINDCKKKHNKTEWYTLQIKNAVYLRYVCILNATLLFVTMSRIILAQNNDIKIDANTAVFSTILMLIFLIWRQSILTTAKKATTPEDRLTFVTKGKLPEDITEEETAETPVNGTAIEPQKKTPAASSNENKAMTRMGWANAVTQWRAKHKNDTRYLTSDKEALFTLAEATDMAQAFYLQGRLDEKDGVTEYDRIWNRKDNE